MGDAKLQKWGKSQGVRLPKQALERARLQVGDELAIEVGEHEIVLRKIAEPKYDLAELVARTPNGHQAKEIGTGSPGGAEKRQVLR